MNTTTFSLLTYLIFRCLRLNICRVSFFLVACFSATLIEFHGGDENRKIRDDILDNSTFTAEISLNLFADIQQFSRIRDAENSNFCQRRIYNRFSPPNLRWLSMSLFFIFQRFFIFRVIHSAAASLHRFDSKNVTMWKQKKSRTNWILCRLVYSPIHRQSFRLFSSS